MALTMTDHLTMSDENHLGTYDVPRDSTSDLCHLIWTEIACVSLSRLIFFLSRLFGSHLEW